MTTEMDDNLREAEAASQRAQRLSDQVNACLSSGHYAAVFARVVGDALLTNLETWVFPHGDLVKLVMAIVDAKDNAGQYVLPLGVLPDLRLQIEKAIIARSKAET